MRRLHLDIEGEGEADKNLDWLGRKSEALSVFGGTERVKGNLDALFVITTNIGVNDLDELPDSYILPFSRMEQLSFQPPEEALSGSVIRLAPSV